MTDEPLKQFEIRSEATARVRLGNVVYQVTRFSTLPLEDELTIDAIVRHENADEFGERVRLDVRLL